MIILNNASTLTKVAESRVQHLRNPSFASSAAMSLGHVEVKRFQQRRLETGGLFEARLQEFLVGVPEVLSSRSAA